MISVVVPAYNAEQTIGACIDALYQQTAPRTTYEVIVVDDGSTDATARVAEQFGARVVSIARRGPAAARNRGLAEAIGDIILFTDADCVPLRDWIERMTAPIYLGADGVKGAYLTQQRRLLPRFIQLEFEERYRHLAQFDRIDFVDTYAAGYRRDVLAGSSGFDSTFAYPSVEDVDLSFRLASQGFHFVFEPQARVYHKHAERLWTYLSRKFRFGTYRVVVYGRFPTKVVGDTYTPRNMRLEIGLAGLTFAALFGSIIGVRTLRLGALLAIAHVLMTLPFAVRAARVDPAVGLAAPALLFLRSCAQVCGIIAGIARVARMFVTGASRW